MLRIICLKYFSFILPGLHTYQRRCWLCNLASPSLTSWPCDVTETVTSRPVTTATGHSSGKRHAATIFRLRSYVAKDSLAGESLPPVSRDHSNHTLEHFPPRRKRYNYSYTHLNGASRSRSSSRSTDNTSTVSSYLSFALPTKPSKPRQKKIQRRRRETGICKKTEWLPLSGLQYQVYDMGSLASRSRNTTIHVTQIQETRLQVQGHRVSPKTRNASTGNNGDRTIGERVVNVTNTFGVGISSRRSPNRDLICFDEDKGKWFPV